MEILQEEILCGDLNPQPCDLPGNYPPYSNLHLFNKTLSPYWLPVLWRHKHRSLTPRQ